MALIPAWDNRDDDADAVILHYDNGTNFEVEPGLMNRTLEHQRAMFNWAQHNIVDPVAIKRGFQVLEVAINHTDQAISDAAMHILAEASRNSNAEVTEAAEHLRENFSDFANEIFQRQEAALTEMNSLIQRNAQQSVQRVDDVALQAHAAAHTAQSATAQVDALRKRVSRDVDENRNALSKLNQQLVVKDSEILDVQDKVRRAEETIEAMKTHNVGSASAASVKQLRDELRKLQATIGPMKEEVQLHTQLLEDTTQTVQTIAQEIATLRRVADQLAASVQQVAARGASKDEVKEAIHHLEEAVRQQRASERRAHERDPSPIDVVTKNEFHNVTKHIDMVCDVLAVLHFPQLDLSNLQTTEKIEAFKKHASRLQPPEVSSHISVSSRSSSSIEVLSQARPARHSTTHTAASPAPRRPTHPATNALNINPPIRQAPELANGLVADRGRPPMFKDPRDQPRRRYVDPFQDPFDPSNFKPAIVDDMSKEDDFLQKLRRQSRSRRESIDSDTDSMTSAATDPENVASIQRSLGRTAECELRVPQANTHLTLLTFGKLDKVEFIARWRERMRKYVKGTKDQADSDHILQQMAASHQMMGAAVKSRNAPAVYAAIAAHKNALSEAMRFELRAQGAAGFILDSVERAVDKAVHRKRKFAFDFEDVMEKVARYTQPRLGQQANFQPRRGRGGTRGRQPWYPTLLMQPHQQQSAGQQAAQQQQTAYPQNTYQSYGRFRGHRW